MTLPLTIAHEMKALTVTCMSAGLAGSEIFRELGWVAWESASGLFSGCCRAWLSAAAPGGGVPRPVVGFLLLVAGPVPDGMPLGSRLAKYSRHTSDHAGPVRTGTDDGMRIR